MASVSASETILDCPICMEKMTPPKKIYSCTSGHSICENCTDRVSECPTCRVSMGPGEAIRNLLVEDVFRELTLSSSNQPEPDDKKTEDKASMLLVTTTGPAAEYQGDMFGLYREDGLHNGVPYYRQLNKSKGQLLYQYSKDKWFVSDILGEDDGFLRNLTSSDTVPVSGWQYAEDDDEWQHDEGMRVTQVDDVESVKCGDITITLSGEAAEHWSDCAGVFKPMGEFSMGRQAFRNPQTDKYLSVRPGAVIWGVRDNVDSTTASLASGCAPDLCPASHRASYNDRFNIKHWQYVGDDGEWHDSADIVVKCSTHSSPNESVGSGGNPVCNII